MNGFDTVDLTNCDQEPIHTPGSIQPHGCLLACEGENAIVVRHSLNAGDLLGLEDAELLGRPLVDLIGREAAHSVNNALARSHDASRPGLLFEVPIETTGGAFDIAAHIHDGVAIVEFEPSPGTERDGPLEIGRALISRLRPISDKEQLLKQTSRLVRGLLGYDRVMVYRFAEDGSGKVISEAKRAGLESFLGQHFPTSDIPRQARALYLQNTIRIVSDSSGSRVAIEPVLNREGRPLDLSFAHLRSVSPIHCEYLRNMGVHASMSISIIVGGQLWGLIACHHYAPRRLSMSRRVAAEMFGEFFSLHLEALSQQKRLNLTNRARRILDRMLHDVTHQDDAVTFLRSKLEDIHDLMPCDGVGLWIDSKWAGFGSVPPAAAVPQLATLIAQHGESAVWSTYELSRDLPSAAAYSADVSGVLAIPLSQIARDYLFFFRKEIVQTIEWAGDPKKTYETGPHGDRLTPRKSFSIWKETVEGQSERWAEADIEIAEAARGALLDVIMRQSELLASERRKADLRQKLLNEELNHRVKNILALIKSLVSQPVEPGKSIEDYVASLKGRILALSKAHDQVVRNDGGGALRALLEAELSPFGDLTRSVTLTGPDIGLDSRAYSVMALVIHELATNAVKYGALSADGGELKVDWSWEPGADCTLAWCEAGGPPVRPPSRRGFGSLLVERSVPFDLGGESSIDYAVGGLSARFVIPAEFAAPAETILPEHAPSATPREHREDPLATLRVLLVEDQLTIAIDAETMVTEQGAADVDLASTTAEALRHLHEAPPDIAVLDVNLGVETSLTVAEELQKRNIPFVFATGYGDTTMIPDTMQTVPIVRKPYDSDTLANALTDAMEALRPNA